MLMTLPKEFIFKTSEMSDDKYIAQIRDSDRYLISDYKPLNGKISSSIWTIPKILKNINDKYWFIVDQPAMIIDEDGNIC